jgi:osmotically-inducible protein OsmY
MKKILALIILSGCASLLQADYYYGNQPGCPGNYQSGQQYYDGGQGSQYGYAQGYQSPYGYQGQQQYGQQQYGQQQYGQQAPNSPQYGQQFHKGSQPSSYGHQSQGSQKMYGNGSSYGAGGGGSQNNDQRLTNQIQESLQSAFTSKYNNVNAYVNNGYVTLKGSVPTQEDKSALEQKVRNMEGVKGVNNQVTVQGQTNGNGNGNGQRYNY